MCACMCVGVCGCACMCVCVCVHVREYACMGVDVVSEQFLCRVH